MSNVIAVTNQKGGVGKSTTVVNLGAAYGIMGKKVLIIDFDPQGNTTTSLGINKKDIRKTVYELLIDECDAVDVIIPTEFQGVSIIPTTQKLSGASIELFETQNRSLKLKQKIESIRNHYDYIFIDCAPTLDLLTLNALVAADSVLVPLQCEFLSLEGLVELKNTINRIQNTWNPNLRVEGILFTMYVARYTITAQIASTVKRYFEGDVLKTVIPRNVAISEAPSAGKPVIYYNKKAKGSKAYMELAEELIKRNKKRNKR